jgi:phage terminase large subunit GpA-like protein
LVKLVALPRSRDSENTITHKNFPGGSLDFVGANSPVDLSSRPKRIILSDEIDKFPPSAGSEGDPLRLGRFQTKKHRTPSKGCAPFPAGLCPS